MSAGLRLATVLVARHHGRVARRRHRHGRSGGHKAGGGVAWFAFRARDEDKARRDENEPHVCRSSRVCWSVDGVGTLPKPPLSFLPSALNNRFLTYFVKLQKQFLH